MSIVGFNFTKMGAEKKSGVKGKISVSNNVNISDIQESNLSIGPSKQKGVKMQFNFASKYEPDMGTIAFEGNLMYIGDEKLIKEMLSDWKKKKKFNDTVMTEVLNYLLQRCNVQSLIMSKDVNLPPPIPLPKVDIKKK